MHTCGYGTISGTDVNDCYHRLLIIISSALNVHTAFADQRQSVVSQNLPGAENFLVNQYNSTVGLAAEYPASNTYWLYSDNFLASFALQNVNSSNTTLTRISENISRTLSGYVAGISDPINQYMILNSSVFAFYASTNYNVSNKDGATIAITLNNGTPKLNPNNYADIAFLEALYYDKIGQKSEAVSLFEIGADMFDGIGIKDIAFSGTYQTYKLALYIYAAKFLGQNYSSSAETTLLNTQGSNGGFYTGYNASYSTTGTLTNVETTSLAILAITILNQSTQTQAQSTISRIENSSTQSPVSTSVSSTTNQIVSPINVSSTSAAPSSSQTASSQIIFSNSQKTVSSSTSVVIPTSQTSSSYPALPYLVVGIVFLTLAALSVLVLSRKKNRSKARN